MLIRLRIWLLLILLWQKSILLSKLQVLKCMLKVVHNKVAHRRGLI